MTDTQDLLREAPGSAEDTVICGCTQLSLAALRRRIAVNPAMSFETLIAETGAGTKCTACLLDLEYHFVEAQRDPNTGPVVRTGDEEPAEREISFKRKLYRWLDRISPMVVFPLSNTVPVLFGRDIEQFVWITNRSMLFEGNVCAPMMKMALIVRDREGRTVRTFRQDVTAESSWRCNVSSCLAERYSDLEPGRLYGGSVEIQRIGASAGIRGTTRPQIEIVTAGAACAVHGQAMSGPGRFWFSCLNRPADERMYFAVLNGSERGQTVKISYPVDVPGIEPIVHDVAVPAHGTVLHQLSLPAPAAQAIGSNAVTVSWKAETTHKLWGICTTPQLDRISIDHM